MQLRIWTALEKQVQAGDAARSPSACRGKLRTREKNYDHGRTRTCSLLIRSQALYPMAIEPHGPDISCFPTEFIRVDVPRDEKKPGHGCSAFAIRRGKGTSMRLRRLAIAAVVAERDARTRRAAAFCVLRARSCLACAWSRHTLTSLPILIWTFHFGPQTPTAARGHRRSELDPTGSHRVDHDASLSDAVSTHLRFGRARSAGSTAVVLR